MANLLLVDLDGTVRRCKSDPAGFINLPFDQEIIPEAAAVLRQFAANGFAIVGVSNQGGVDQGYKSIGEAIDEQFETLRLAPQIDAIFFCPKMDGSQVVQVTSRGAIVTATPHTFQELGIRSFRKPSPGMLQLAMIQREATPATTLMVGDRPEDEEAAAAARVQLLSHQAWYAGELRRAA